MKAEINGKQIELEPNSKPILVKRMVSDGFDMIIIFGLFMLFTMLIMKMPIASEYHAHFDAYTSIEKSVIEEYQNDAAKISEVLNGHSVYQYELLAANLHGYILKAIACFAAELLILLVFPLLNKEKQTPGKRMTGLLAFNERRHCKITWYQVLFRFLFILVIDSLVLFLWTGTLTFLLVAVLRLIEILLNRKNKTICDLLTGVMIIEKLSYDGIN